MDSVFVLAPLVGLEPNDPFASLTHKCANALTPTTSWGGVAINPTKELKKQGTLLRTLLFWLPLLDLNQRPPD